LFSTGSSQSWMEPGHQTPIRALIPTPRSPGRCDLTRTRLGAPSLRLGTGPRRSCWGRWAGAVRRGRWRRPWQDGCWSPRPYQHRSSSDLRLRSGIRLRAKATPPSLAAATASERHPVPDGGPSCHLSSIPTRSRRSRNSHHTLARAMRVSTRHPARTWVEPHQVYGRVPTPARPAASGAVRNVAVRPGASGSRRSVRSTLIRLRGLPPAEGPGPASDERSASRAASARLATRLVQLA